MTRRLWLSVVLGLLLTGASQAGNNLGTLRVPEVIQEYLGTMMGPYVVQDCLPTVPVTSLTLPATACTAMIREEGTPEKLVPIVQAATALGPLVHGDGTYWLAVHTDTSTTMAGWTRTAGGENRAGSHYLWQFAPAKPVNPPRGLVIGRVTVAGGVITAVADLRLPASYALRGVFEPTDPLYGADATGMIDATAAIQAAEDARSNRMQLYGQVHGEVLSFVAGTYLISAPIIIKAAGIIKGQGRTNTWILAANLAGDTFVTSGFAGGVLSTLSIRDIGFTPVAPKTGGVAIRAITATPTEEGQFGLDVNNIFCNVHFVCIELANSAYARITHSDFSNVQHIGIHVAMSSVWDAGDNVIEGNTFSTSATTGFAAVYLQTSGQRVVNNKFLGFPTAILVDPLVAPALGDMMLANNSIEAYSQYGILVQTSLPGTQVQNLHIMGNQFAVESPPGAAAIAVSGQVINMVITGNIIYSALPNVTGIGLALGSRGEYPKLFAITGNVLTGQNASESKGINIPSVTDNSGTIGANFVSGFFHPYAGTGGAFYAGPVQPGDLAGFGGQGSIVYCVSCMVVSPTDNTCTAGGGGALAVKLDDGQWHCFSHQN